MLAPTADLTGHARPRIATPARSTSTRGPAADAIAKLGGLDLMPWQRLVLDRALEKDLDGSGWTHTEIGVIVARGNGKTKLLAARIAYGLLVEGEDVLGVASNNRSVARELWSDVVRIFTETPELSRYVEELPRKANGQEELKIRTLDGRLSRYRIGAANSGTRGFRASLLVVDEVRELTSPEAFAAMTGVQAGLPQRTQRWLVSTAGDDSSLVLNELRDRGRLAATDPDTHPRLAWLEWSADPGAPIDDPQSWRQANPALGYRVSAELLAQEAASVPENHFRTEYLNLWVEVLSSVIPRTEWEAALDPTNLERSWPAWIGLEIAPDRLTAALVLAARDPDNRTHLRLLETITADPGGSVDPRLLASLAHRWHRQTGAIQVIGDAWLAKLVLADLDAKRIPTQPITTAQLALGTANLRAGIRSRSILHDGNPVLTAHVMAAGTRPSGDGAVILSRRHSTGPIAAAVASTAAVYAAAAPDTPTPVIRSRAR